MMDTCLVFIVFLLEGLCQAGPVSLSGLVGDQIKIKCSHTFASTNVKYFCKGTCNGKDILVTSRENKHSNPKYILDNTGNTFYVTVSDLTLRDSGTYWCGVERVGVDTYTEINLTVLEGSSENVANVSYSERLVNIAAGFGVVLLLLAGTLFLFFRHRKKKTKALPGGGNNGIAAETSPNQKDTFTHTNIPSSNSVDSQAHQSLVLQQDACVSPQEVTYVQVLHVSQSQESKSIYSAKSFSNFKDCNTVPLQSTKTIYSSLKDI